MRTLLALILALSPASAHASRTWWEVLQLDNPAKPEILKKVQKKPERATDALLWLTMGGRLCADREYTTRLLSLGADPSATRRIEHGIYHWDGDFFYWHPDVHLGVTEGRVRAGVEELLGQGRGRAGLQCLPEHRLEVPMWTRACQQADSSWPTYTGDAGDAIFAALVDLELAHDRQVAAYQAIPFIVRAGRYGWAQTLAQRGLDLNLSISPGLTADHQELYPARYAAMTLADYAVLEGPNPATWRLFIDEHGLKLTPLADLNERIQMHEQSVADATQWRQDWDAERQEDAAIRTGNRAFNECIQRGVDAVACRADPSTEPERDVSLVLQLFDPARVAESQQLIDSTVPIAISSGESSTGIVLSHTTFEATPSSPESDPDPGPCGFRMNTTIAANVGPDKGLCHDDDECEASVERWYSRNPGCPEPSGPPRKPPAHTTGVHQE